MNDTNFFYQWWVAQADREKFMIVSHQELETSNVILISYKESSSYSQWMMNWILHFYKNFIRFYIDDLIIFLKILNNHKWHLNTIWSLFDEIRISLNRIKTYLDYSSIIFFRTMSRQIWYDNFQEMNCSHLRDKISEKSQKSWDLFRSYRMIMTIYFLLCSTYWIFTTKKNHLALKWSHQRKI